MAYIDLYSRTSDSLTVRLAGLDKNYTGTKRTVTWYVGSTKKTSGTINSGIITSQTFKLSSLKASTKYTVKCVISNIQGMSSNVTLTEVFWTKDPTPTISSFTVTQTSTGTKKAKCSWKCSNLISGATYEIYVDGWYKAGGTASTSGSTTINLDYFDSYQATIYVYNNDESASKSYSFTLYDYNVKPTNLSVTRTYGGLKLSWSGATNATSFQAKIVRGYDEYPSTKTVTSKSVTFTGLQYGVRYFVYVKGTRTGYDSGWCFGYSFTTLPAKPELSISIKKGIITVDYDLEYSSSVSRVYINLYDSNNSSLLQTGSVQTNSSGTVQFYKVDDGDYYIRASTMFNFASYYTDYDGRVEVMCDTIYEAITVNSAPDLWSWTSSNGSATAYQTQLAYSAITSNGDVKDFNYRVWNDLVDKVKETLDAAGDTWNTKYSTYSNAKLSGSNQILTATKFNSVRYNIEIHKSTGITERSSGDIVYGWYFTTLASCLNSWINTF